jgi:hypothetical protein
MEEATSEQNRKLVSWQKNDVEEANRLWILCWEMFFDVLSDSEPTSDILQITPRFRAYAARLKGETADPSLRAVIDFVEAEHYYCMGDIDPKYYDQTLAIAIQTIPGLRGVPCQAYAQHLVLVSAANRWPASMFAEQLRLADRMVDAADGSDIRQRTRLLEGMGRSLGLRGDSRAWDYLRLAKEEAETTDPIGYVMTLRSEMVAVLHAPTGVDRERLGELGGRALTRLSGRGWRRKEASIQAIARAGGVLLEGAS